MNPDEEITLTTSLIEKQSQSQILVGLFHSTSVFVIFSYIVNGVSIPVAVPYIVVDSDMPYQNTLTDLTFTFSITLTPSNKRVVQKL